MKYFYELLILCIVAIVWLWLYQSFGDKLYNSLFSSEQEYVVYLKDVALQVTVADEQEERMRGLSGVTELGDFEGKLFIFDKEGDYGIWMKDMHIPMDVLWFNDDLELVHVERNMTPDTYPKVFTSDEPARFVLETNAYFVDSLKVEEGNRLILPPEILPHDIRDSLQD